MENRDLFDAADLAAFKQEIRSVKSSMLETEELLPDSEMREVQELLDEGNSGISADSVAYEGRLNQLFDRILGRLRLKRL